MFGFARIMMLDSTTQSTLWERLYKSWLLGVVIACISIRITECNHGNGKGRIVIAGLFPVSDNIPEATIGKGVKPAVDLAIKMINENPDLLPNHHLDIVDNDTKVCICGPLVKYFSRSKNIH